MALFDTQFQLPDIVYHGTTMKAIIDRKGFKYKLINYNFMTKIRQRDFGTGFYTTIDLRQAMLWPCRKLWDLYENNILSVEDYEVPAVVRIRLRPNRYSDQISVLDFRGESREWARFVLLHRYDSTLHNCSCGEHYQRAHPHIVCGCLADNNTGEVIDTFIRNNRSVLQEKDILWFANQITHSKTGMRLNGLELGDQIAFFDDRLNDILEMEGYYKLNTDIFFKKVAAGDTILAKEDWDYYDQNDQKQKHP